MIELKSKLNRRRANQQATWRGYLPAVGRGNFPVETHGSFHADTM